MLEDHSVEDETSNEKIDSIKLIPDGRRYNNEWTACHWGRAKKVTHTGLNPVLTFKEYEYDINKLSYFIHRICDVVLRWIHNWKK